MAHVRYSENMELILEEKKCFSFIQRAKLSKQMQFGPVADVYMAKKEEL